MGSKFYRNLHLETIIGKVQHITKDYDNRVRRSHSKASLRVRNKQWMDMVDAQQSKKGRSVAPI